MLSHLDSIHFPVAFVPTNRLYFGKNILFSFRYTKHSEWANGSCLFAFRSLVVSPIRTSISMSKLLFYLFQEYFHFITEWGTHQMR